MPGFDLAHPQQIMGKPDGTHNAGGCLAVLYPDICKMRDIFRYRLVCPRVLPDRATSTVICKAAKGSLPRRKSPILYRSDLREQAHRFTTVTTVRCHTFLSDSLKRNSNDATGLRVRISKFEDCWMFPRTVSGPRKFEPADSPIRTNDKGSLRQILQPAAKIFRTTLSKPNTRLHIIPARSSP